MAPRKNRAGGFSLVELMLALALGLVVVTGIVQLFVGNSQTYNVLTGQARMQESARFALEFISRAARSAGYFGCAPQTENLVKGLRGDWDTLPEFDVMRMVQGEDNVSAGWNPSWVPHTGGTAMVAANAIDLTTVEPGTDFVVFRGMQLPGQRLLDTLQPSGDPIVAAAGTDPGFGVDDVVVLADCQQGAVFRVTGIDPTGTNEVTLRHATSGSGNRYVNADNIASPAGPVPFTLSLIGRSYGPDAAVGALQSTFFYVAPGAGEDNEGNPVLALWQKVGNAAPVELVQGVEDLQILYGIDTTDDGTTNANRYVIYDDIPDPNDPSSIVSLRVSVVVSSVDGVTEGRAPLRRTFSKTILLRNASPEV